MINAIFLAVLVLAMVIFWITGRRYYGKAPPSEGKKTFTDTLLPAALYLLKVTGYQFGTIYEARIKIKLGELYGSKDVNKHIRLFIAKKLVILWSALVVFAGLGLLIKVDSTYAVFAAIVSIAVFIAPDRQLDNRLKKRTRELQIDFPEFINKFILLVDAGMSVRGAIHKIVEGRGRDRTLDTELIQTLNEIASGRPELKAYEDFARRCRLHDITAFSSALMQNLRKGNDELIPLLKLQAATCWQNRRNAARKLGEEASSRLLLPLIITFLAIMIMLMAPAVMQMNI